MGDETGDDDCFYNPFCIVNEFKENLKKEMEAIFNGSGDTTITGSCNTSVSSDKENNLENDSPCDNKINLTLSPKNNIPKPRRSRRGKEKKKSNVEIILVGDASDSDESPSPVKRGRSSPNNNSCDVVVIDDNLSTAAKDWNDTIDSSFDVDKDNEEMNIKIIWMFEGNLKYKLKKGEPFSNIYSKLAKDKKVDEDYIVLCKNDMKIKPTDTPKSINLSVTDILSGYTTRSQPVWRNLPPTKHPNGLEVKVITDSKKDKELVLVLNKGDKMLVLFSKVAEELQCPLNNVQLWFDGEKVNLQDTTKDLDLEGGECFELKLKG